jgi:hypothetical protein
VKIENPMSLSGWQWQSKGIFDPLKSATDFFSGFASTYDGGLTRRLQSWMGTDVYVDYNSGSAKAGQIAGIPVVVGLAVANPCGAAGAAGNGLRLINGAQAVGGAINAGEKFGQGDWIGGGLDLAGSLLGAHGMLKVCFAAGTPLLTPDGARPIEQFKPGDMLLSRSEFSADGALEPKAVEEVFVRIGLIFHLHIGRQVIRTTAQHPFFVQGRGWVEAGVLNIGDLLLSHDGQWLPVEDLFDTGQYETVYNLAIADYHTYFVGQFSWGFSVWAHNVGRCNVAQQADLLEQQGMRVIGKIPPGNVSSQESFVYALFKKGKIFRYGESNDPGRRLTEHIAKYGEVFLKVISGPYPKEIAKAIQNGHIQRYMKCFGRKLPGNPRVS